MAMQTIWAPSITLWRGDKYFVDWPSYWEGKDTAFALITSTPMMFTPADYLLWFWQGGGLELCQNCTPSTILSGSRTR